MKYLALLLLLLLPVASSAQDLSWETLNVPKANDRYNDLWFTDPLTGWAIIPAEGSTPGRIYHTIDGGDTWTVKLEMNNHFRAITFLDGQRGFVGSLFSDEISPLYKTTDAGMSWDTVDKFDGPKPEGICGMMSVDASTVVGIGKVFGPAYFIRTTDRGETWHSQLLPELIKSGIDCYFWSRDSGIVVGGTEDHNAGHTVILGTTDGGQSWIERFRGTDSLEWCWKISFPSPDRGYVSVEDHFGVCNLLITTDRGLSWEERQILPMHQAFQGIGFINDSIGWIGGRTATLVSTDMGVFWNQVDTPRNVNRFRFFGDTLGYAVGQQVYRLRRQTTKLAVHALTEIEGIPIFDRKTQIIKSGKSISGKIVVTDITGRIAIERDATELQKGIDLSELPKGIYLFQVINSKIITIKIAL